MSKHFLEALFLEQIDVYRSIPIKVFQAATGGVLGKKSALKNFEIFTGNHLYWSLFLTELQAFRPATSLRRDSNTRVFL